MLILYLVAHCVLLSKKVCGGSYFPKSICCYNRFILFIWLYKHYFRYRVHWCWEMYLNESMNSLFSCFFILIIRIQKWFYLFPKLRPIVSFVILRISVIIYIICLWFIKILSEICFPQGFKLFHWLRATYEIVFYMLSHWSK